MFCILCQSPYEQKNSAAKKVLHIIVIGEIWGRDKPDLERIDVDLIKHYPRAELGKTENILSNYNDSIKLLVTLQEQQRRYLRAVVVVIANRPSRRKRGRVNISMVCPRTVGC